MLDTIGHNFFNAKIAAETLPAILDGMVVTLVLSGFIIVSGIFLGLLLAMIRALRVRWINVLIVIFADVFRALPPLVILFVFYFALPFVNLSMTGFVTTWLGLTLALAAFAEEIFWAGITSVNKGQWEAARSTGLSYGRTLVLVIVPQASRLTIAPLTNRTIAITKMTALASTVAVEEILANAATAQAYSANTTPLTMAAAAYLAIFLPLVVFSRWVERRYAWKH
ncbi:amino acid ABC transporter permease [Alcaligenaceae bacterium]|nr:amino acid ABC transporter permease [Alcaligenaceae bacterium]